MSTARYPLPTDLVALVSFDGRVYPNEAKPWDRLGLDERAHPLETALEQWFSFATGKHTWVSVRGATIRGLISARRRAKPSAWEVEVLIDADEDKGVVLSLFSRMAAGIGKLGAEKVFLRLDAGSPLVDTARAAGFFPYVEEVLYRRDGGPVPSSGASLRPRAKGDMFGVFQLYSHTAPANVRAIEGATFREWQAAQEKWGGRPADLLAEEGGAISAWLRVCTGHEGRFRMLLQPGCGDVEGVLAAALARVDGARSVLTLVPAYCGGLAGALNDAGFEPTGDYVHLAMRLTRPVAELAQETAGNAVPVS